MIKGVCPRTAGIPNEIAGNLALMVEAACTDFEALQRLIRRETRLVSATFDDADHPDSQVAVKALAQSFVFHVRRARRILEKGASGLPVSRADRKSFKDATKAVIGVRDVNEHGFDPVPLPKSKRSVHTHPGAFSAKLDETAS